MKKIYVIYFLFFIFIFVAILAAGCFKSTSEQFNYTLFYGEGKIILKNAVIVSLKKQNDLTDSVYIKNEITRDSNSFKQVTKAAEGIFRCCGNKLIKVNSFTDKNSHYNCQKTIFRADSVSLEDLKIYYIGKNQFKIYHFHEYSPETGRYETYYLQNFGFIVYYNLWLDEYLLCSSSISNNYDDQTIQQIGKQLISDTTFFARYILIKIPLNLSRRGKGRSKK